MARELFELIDDFRGTAQVEDIMDALEVSCFIRKLQLNNVLEKIVFDDKNFSYVKRLSENTKSTELSPVVLNDMASCLNSYSLSILNDCVKEIAEYSDDELKKLVKQLQSESAKRLHNTMFSAHDTEESISKLVNYLVKDKEYKSVLDLCSGSGSFLIYNLLNENRDKLVGYELVGKNVIFSLMLSYILDGNIEIHNEDVLATSVDGKFDLCFTQCPIGLRYKQKIVDNQTFAILSHGSLSNSVEMKSRQMIIDNKLLEKVIAMPQGTLSYTNIQYDLLVFSKDNNEVTFVDARNCFITDKKFKQFDLESFKKTEKSSAYTFSYDEIEKNDCSFDLSRYLYSVEIPESMNPTVLSKCADVIGGYVYSTHKKVESPVTIKMVKVENFDGSVVDATNAQEIEIDESKVSNYLIQKGDVLLASKGTIIKAAIVQNIDEPCIFNNNITVIRIKQGVKMVPEFLLSYLNSDLGMKELMMRKTGTIVMNIPLKELRDMDVPMLDEDTQEVISVRFKKLQQKLVEAKKLVAEYENKLNELFDTEVRGIICRSTKRTHNKSDE